MPEQEHGQEASTLAFLVGATVEADQRAAVADHKEAERTGYARAQRDEGIEADVPRYTQAEADERRRRRGCGTVLAVAAVAGLVGATFVSCGDDEPERVSSTIEITAEDLNQFNITTFNEEACDDATETAGTATYNDLLGPVPDLGFKKPNMGANANQDSKMSVDAIHNPFTTEDKYTELFASICENDVMRVNLGQFLANLEIDDVKLANLDGNGFLQRYATGVENINDVVAQDLELIYDAPEIDREDQTAVDALIEDAELRENDAERMIELLNRLAREGLVTSQQTVQNYRHGEASMTLGIPEVELGPEYVGDFLVFTAQTKAGECLLRIGFNAGTMIDGVHYPGDQRLAVLVCETPPEITTTTNPDGTTTTVRHNTTTTVGRNTTTTVRRTTTTTGDTTTTTRVTTTTTRIGDKVVKCITPGGSVTIVDVNKNGIADEPECQQLQDNGPGSGGEGDDTPGTTRVNPTTPTSQPNGTTPTTGVRNPGTPAPPTTGTPPPPTMVTQPPQPND